MSYIPAESWYEPPCDDEEEPADEDCVCEEPEMDDEDFDADEELDKRYAMMEAKT
jgi:hypothetical protein